MATPQWTDELDDLLLVTAGSYSTWLVRMYQFNSALKTRNAVEASKQDFTTATMHSRFQELFQKVPAEPATSLLVRWSASQTQLLTSIDRNTKGESLEAKTMVFNRSARLNGWKVATLQQVKAKLVQVSRNDANLSAKAHPHPARNDELGNDASQPSDKRTKCMSNGSKRQKVGDGVASEKIAWPSNVGEGNSVDGSEVENHFKSMEDIKLDKFNQDTRYEGQKEMKNDDVERVGDSQDNTIATHMRSLVNNKLLRDVTFLVEGSRIFAHKNICARYSKFHALFSEQESCSIRSAARDSGGNTQDVLITDVTRKTFLFLLQYVYTDYIDVSDDNAMELFVAANRTPS
ncbi:Kelch repeat-containing protein [Phytophthora cinnamomi]|uniref:Kelch repeat-containing protein n=1 Tax=Phytophthora cinnamomi TaxID=4785 RepID=UPI00355A15E2|nr:Kelch repeat-containing protein [Phytophthora cinnamomi]